MQLQLTKKHITFPFGSTNLSFFFRELRAVHLDKKLPPILRKPKYYSCL